MARRTEETVVKRSRTGLGLFAAVPVLRGMRIIQFTGERVAKSDKKRFTGKYLFRLDDLYAVDGKGRENLARYVNHSCKPNAYAELVDGRIWIVAKRRIREGEEITIDYGRGYFERHIKPKGCKCKKCDPAA